MSRFTEALYSRAETSLKGMITGEPASPVRRTWGDVHRLALRIAGGLSAAGVGHGDAVGVLAGVPSEVAPTAQAVWMRGASVTMLHQPTPRTNLLRWAEDTMTVLKMIDAKAVVVSDPFMAAAPQLSANGIDVLTIAQLCLSRPAQPVATGEDDLALLQLTSGSTGSPKAVQISHGNFVANADAMLIGSKFDVEKDVIVSWLPLFHDMGMTGYLMVPMYVGAELVKVTPADFLRDPLLWAKLISKYSGTLTAAPNFAYKLLARRLRQQEDFGQFDLSTLRWALSGAEQVDPADVEQFCTAAAPFGFRPEAIVAAYGMAESTVAVSFGECGAGLIVDEVDRDLLEVSGQAELTDKGRTRRLATLGPPLQGIQVRVVGQDGSVLASRRSGVIQVRGGPVARGYSTRAGFVGAQDNDGWYDTGDLGYLTDAGHVVVCGRVKDVIIMAGRNIYPSDVERAAGRVSGVRPGCAAAVRAQLSHGECFFVVVESVFHDDEVEVRRIQRDVAHEVVSEVNARPRRVLVLKPGMVPKTPSGKLRRAEALALVS